MKAAGTKNIDGGTWLSDAPVDLWTIARWAGTAAVVLFFIFPMIFMFMVSFKAQPDIASGGFIPQEWFWQNYPDAWNSVAVGTYLRNSIVVAACGALVTLVIAVPATHAIVRYRIGGKFLPAFILATYVATPDRGALPPLLPASLDRAVELAGRHGPRLRRDEPARRLLALVELRAPPAGGA